MEILGETLPQTPEQPKSKREAYLDLIESEKETIKDIKTKEDLADPNVKVRLNNSENLLALLQDELEELDDLETSSDDEKENPDNIESIH
ncbi:MAG: hypothetical protein WC682_04555 [Parcubacteria group bacterium]|jgi:hypothetical protein